MRQRTKHVPVLLVAIAAIGLISGGSSQEIPIPLNSVSINDDNVHPPMQTETAPTVALYADGQRLPQAPPELVELTTIPMLPPDGAMEAFHRQLATQALELTGYSAKVLIRAEIAGTGHSGEFELRREHLTPDLLKFVPLRFNGDAFIKHNVIGRMLQFQVDHKRGTESMLGTIQELNYKITYEKTTHFAGHTAYVYKLKPRSKRPGLFAGRIVLDAFSGNVLRTEGKFTKSPSFFIKRLEFVQEYTQMGGFTFVSHAHSEVRVRMLGRVTVDVYESEQEPVSAAIIRADIKKPSSSAPDIPPKP